MERMEISEEEIAVLSAMRRSDRAGRAIFKYAMRFDNETSVNLDAEPFVLHPSERP